jgi:CheY-like chemotaxis protein
VSETLDVMRGSLPEGVKLETRTPRDEPLVTLGNATLLHQVVMNLCTNAVQAMGGGGTLRVAVEPVDLPKPLALRQDVLLPGEYVKLTVADDGGGMDEATLEHIFEPFFTTKEAGRGTGLGLALVYRIVTEAGGGVAVASRPAEGTTFEVYLPRVREAQAADPDEEVPVERGDGESILLVDDEIPLLDMMCEMLRRMGYEPEPFSDPLAALAALEAQPRAYDLLLTDEAMPGLSGSALAAEARKARPDLPVVILTGCAPEGFAGVADEAGVREVLLKPVAAADLAAALGRALAAVPVH